MMNNKLLYDTEVPNLTKEETDVLFKRLRYLESDDKTVDSQKAQDIRKRIIESVYRLIYDKAVSFWEPKHGEAALHDLIQIGMTEANKCLNTYDYQNKSGAKFSSYVSEFVNPAINKYVAKKNNPMNWPHELLQTCSKVIFTRNLFLYTYKREPSMNEVANLLEVDVRIIEMMFRMQMNLGSLDAQLSDEPNSATLYDLIEDENAEHPFESTTNSELSELLYESMEDLTERDYLNITLRWGLRTGYATSAEAIIDEYNKPDSEIRAFEELIISKTGGDLSLNIHTILGCHEDQGDCKPSDGLLNHLGL